MSRFPSWGRVEGDGTQQSEAYAFLACQLHYLLADTGHTAEGYDQILGVVCHVGRVADLVGLDLGVLLLELDVEVLLYLRVESKGCDGVAVAARVADGCP